MYPYVSVGSHGQQSPFGTTSSRYILINIPPSHSPPQPTRCRLINPLGKMRDCACVAPNTLKEGFVFIDF